MTGRTATQVLASVILLALAPLPAVGQPDVLSDLGDGVVAFAEDGLDVLTFPADFDRDEWYALGAVLAVGGALYAVDGDIQAGLRENRHRLVNRGLREVGDFFEPIGLMGETNRFYAGGVVLGYLTGWDRLRWAGQDILFSHWLASASRQLLRQVGRRRPEGGVGPREFDGEGTSFPSGHASSALQVAAVFSHHIDWWPATIALYSVAGTIVFQRIDSDSHWASDAWVGAFLGWGVSQIVLRNAEGRRREGASAAAQPLLDLRTGTVGVRIPLR